MFEIPSAYMRNLFAKKGFELTDWQKATLIWNAPDKAWEERVSSLNEHLKSINDEKLSKQIIQRIDYENTMLQRFMENDDRFVYVVVENTRCNVGYFANYEMAREYAIKYMEENDVVCQIQKQRIIYTPDDLIVKPTGRWNPHFYKKPPVEDEAVPYGGFETACVSLTKDGAIKHLWSNEMSTEEQAVVDEFNSERFEFQYSKIPFVGKKGTVVKVIYDTDKYSSYGVLMTDTKEWNDYINDSRRDYSDYSDISGTVCFLTEQGLWSQEHINPCYLEFNIHPSFSSQDKKGKAYIVAMIAFTIYWSSDKDKERNARIAIATARQYRDVCLENYVEHSKTHVHDYAKNIQDIIF